MTKDQLIATAQEHRQMWDDCTSRPFTTREAEFATLVRNAAVIEERTALAELCDAMGSPRIAEYLRAQAEIIRKEPT